MNFVLLLVMLTACLPISAAEAFWGGSDFLVEINGTKFTDEDYRHWWSEWQDPGMTVHASLDDYIDFMLLSQEARDMQLTENPRYKKKLQVFLKVRALMQLKSEEIDANKQIPSKQELWAAYLKEYTPLLDLQMIAVQEEEQANVIQGFMAAGVPFGQLAEAAGLKAIAEQVESTGPMRYARIPEELRKAVIDLQADQLAGPVQFGHAWYFIKMVARQDGSEADFESVKQDLIRKSLKRQEYQLTQQLLERLMVQYEVVVDRELVAAIGLAGPKAEDADKIAISIDSLQVPVSFVYTSIKKTQKLRGHAQREAEAFEESKARIVDDILAQTLTEKEALARHYERIPPLKYVFDFYSQYRLVKEFEDTVVRPEAVVSDEDVESFYLNNSSEFTRDGMVEFAKVTTNEKELAEKIAQQLKAGKDFFTIMAPISPAGVKTEKKPLQDFEPLFAEVIKSLASGQVATINDGPDSHFIKVIRSAEKELLPLAMVRDMLQKKLTTDRYQEVHANYVRRLREPSAIKVNESAWNALRKQLQEENVK